jgi:hypothetical protein
MFATFITLAVISFAIAGLRDLARHDGAKILAAMKGRSWAAEPRPSRPFVVRFSSPEQVVKSAWPELRAAA